MSDIIDQRFVEWTEGLSGKDALLAVFNHIRDIPYGIIMGHLDISRGPCDMLSCGEGSCVPKHYLMGIMYQRLGYKIKYCTYSFRWSAMDIEYPGTLRVQVNKAPLTYHLACRIDISGKWVLVDATWDLPLLAAGFPVNVSWDGKGDTRLAVNAVEETVHESAEDRENILKTKMAEYTLPEKLELARLSLELNKWLKSIRHKRN